MRNFSLIISMLCILVLSACATNSRGTLNPEHAGYKLTHSAIFIANAGPNVEELENAIIEALAKEGVKAVGVSKMAMFTRNTEELQRKVWALGVKDVLLIKVADSSGSDVVGYNTHSSATAFGYDGSATAYGSSTSTPMISPHREMSASIVIMDKENNRIWIGNTARQARGLLFMSDGQMISHNVDALVEELKKDGLI